MSSQETPIAERNMAKFQVWDEQQDQIELERSEISGSLRGPREPKNEVKQDQGQKALPIKGDDEGCCHQRGKQGQHAGKLLEAPPSFGAGYTQDVFEGYWGAAAIACLSYLQQMSHLGVLILAMCTSKCVSTSSDLEQVTTNTPSPCNHKSVNCPISWNGRQFTFRLIFALIQVS